MKIYKLIISDYKGGCYLEYIPAKSKKEVLDIYGGNGEIEKLEEFNDYIIDISTLTRTLQQAQYGKMEIDIITRVLYNTIKTR